MDPSVKANEGPNVSYLKDLWHAVQNQEISGKEALIMGLAQRSMNTRYPEQAPDRTFRSPRPIRRPRHLQRPRHLRRPLAARSLQERADRRDV